MHIMLIWKVEFQLKATVMAAAYLSSSVVADPRETIIVMPANLSVEDSFQRSEGGGEIELPSR